MGRLNEFFNKILKRTEEGENEKSILEEINGNRRKKFSKRLYTDSTEKPRLAYRATTYSTRRENGTERNR